MKKKLSFFLSLLALVLILVVPFGFGAQASTETEFQYSPQNEGAIRLISTGYESGRAALHIKFTDKWKTYWKHAGDTGAPIDFKNTRSLNIKNVELLWPVPERFDYYGIETWGYKDEIVLPIKYEVEDAAKPVYLGFDIKWAICDEICIFEEDALSLLVKPGEKSEKNSNLVNKYLKQVPTLLSKSPSIKQSGFYFDEEKLSFSFTSENKSFDENLDLFIFEKSENFRFPTPKIVFSEGRKKVEVITPYERLTKSADLQKAILEITLANKNDSIEAKFEPAKPLKYTSATPKIVDDVGIKSEMRIKQIITSDSISNSSEDWQNSSDSFEILLLAIFFAFLGGLILNIMPCVLPVLSIKIMGILKHNESDKAHIRKSFFATIVGIVTSFLILATMVVVLKSLGHSVSWGMQFQQPEFLIFLALLTLLFACNQLGYFEITLPSFLNDKINKKVDKAGGDSSVVGNFLTGAFATLLATPCTAPFLSTAIAFSLGAGSDYIFLIFAAMGLGMSLPYILVMIFPTSLKFLPKPGNWMNKLKVILSILLLLTTIWLIYVFSSNVGALSATLLFICLLSIFLFLKYAKKFNLVKFRVFLTVIYITIVTFVIPIFYAHVEMGARDPKGVWEKFDRQKIDDYVTDGRVVLVDVTADWCLTCKFNKARVLNPMSDYLKEQEVIKIVGDYTKPSKVLHNYLEEYGTYAIPLNVVYGPNAVKGIVLPSVLTEDNVKNALEEAK